MATRKKASPTEPAKRPVKKTVHYRRCQFQPSATQTLQQMLAQAVSDMPIVKDRTETVDTAATSFRVIASAKQINGMECGTMLIFERGSYQMVINDDPEATALLLSAMKPPMQGTVQQQFVPGVLFYAAFENHLAVVQAASLRTTGLEQHLAWLLRSKCGLLQQNQGFVLADEPKPATKEQIRKSRVKSLSLGRPFMKQEATDTPVEAVNLALATRMANDPSIKKRDVSKFRPDSWVLNVLRGFLPDDAFSQLNLEQTVFDGDLEVWLEIRYPSRTRSQPAESAKLLDDLAIALRDEEGDSVELQLLDGTKVKGSDLKISGTVSLNMKDGIPAVDELYADMAQWLTKLLKNGMVST